MSETPENGAIVSVTTAFPSPAVRELLNAGALGSVIDGRVQGNAGSASLPVIDPSTGETILQLSLANGGDVDLAVRAAREALPAWRSSTPGSRAGLLLALADLIDSEAAVFAELESLDVGKPVKVARVEIPAASDALRFMAGAIRTVQTPAAERYVADRLSMIRREPLGVVGAITPWNYPLMTAVWKIAAALAAGNTMVLKPSELTPLSTLYLAARATELLPAGVLNVLAGDGATVGERIASHPDIAIVSLTGSVRSGIAVAHAGAETLKHVHLELGGKAPVVIFADADVDAAVTAVCSAGFWNSGQECGAATRVLCHERIHDAFVAQLCDAVGHLVVGKPCDGEDVDIGPLVSEAHRAQVDDAVRRATQAGASVALGGAPVEDQPGYFYAPTVLTGVQAGAEVARTEIFGPVVTIERFSSDEEALSRANDTRYGLAASVWTENARRGLRAAEALDFGTVWVNAHLEVASEMPWGGFGMSGIGRELSAYSLEEFSRTKHVMIAS